MQVTARLRRWMVGMMMLVLVVTMSGCGAATTTVAPSPAVALPTASPDPALARISGVITKKGAPVANMELSLVNINGTAVKKSTNAQGAFSFENVALGNNTINLPITNASGKPCLFADTFYDVKAGDTLTKNYDMDALPEGFLTTCSQ